MTPSPGARVLLTVLLVGGTATLPPTPAPLLAAAGLVAGALAVGRPPLRPALVAFGTGALAIAAALLPRAIHTSAGAVAPVALRAGLTLGAAVAASGWLGREPLGPALIAVGTPRALAETIDTLLGQLGRLRDELARLTLARSLRGARGLGLDVGLIATLLTRSARRAERVALARALRGHRLDAASTAARLRWQDAPWLLGACTLLAGARWA